MSTVSKVNSLFKPYHPHLQVDLLMGDLQRERELRQRLQQQMNQAKPRHQVPMAASLGAAGTPPPRACSVSVPWFGSPQQPLPAFVEVDCIDGDNESPSNGATSNGAGASSSSKSLSQDKVQECPRCKREFSADKTKQYRDHVGKCFDSS